MSTLMPGNVTLGPDDLTSGGKLTPEQSDRFIELAINVTKCRRCGKFLPFYPDLREVLKLRRPWLWPVRSLLKIWRHRLVCGPHPFPVRIKKIKEGANLR